MPERNQSYSRETDQKEEIAMAPEEDVIGAKDQREKNRQIDEVMVGVRGESVPKASGLEHWKIGQHDISHSRAEEVLGISGGLKWMPYGLPGYIRTGPEGPKGEARQA